MERRRAPLNTARQRMSYWERLDRYRTDGPEAAGAFALQPAERFRAVVGGLGDGHLAPLGWRRARGLRWTRAVRPQVEAVLEMHAMKSGVGARWGLTLGFVPPVQRPRRLDLSHDPLDHQRDVRPWSLSQFATDEELRADGADLFRRAAAGAEAFCPSGRDLVTLREAFERKKGAQFVRLRFQAYPQEVVAYAAVLGLLGERARAEEELTALDRVPAGDVDRVRRVLNELWARGREAV